MWCTPWPVVHAMGWLFDQGHTLRSLFTKVIGRLVKVTVYRSLSQDCFIIERSVLTWKHERLVSDFTDNETVSSRLWNWLPDYLHDLTLTFHASPMLYIRLWWMIWCWCCAVTTRLYPPRILWQSPTQQIAMRGATWSVKCIFAGRSVSQSLSVSQS